MGTQLPSPKWAQPLTPPQFTANVRCGQPTGWMKTPLCTEIDLGAGHIVLDGDPAPPAKGHSSPLLFGPCLLWPRSPISATAGLLSASQMIGWQWHQLDHMQKSSAPRFVVYASFFIPHFTLRIPQFRILPMTRSISGIDSLQFGYNCPRKNACKLQHLTSVNLVML